MKQIYEKVDAYCTKLESKNKKLEQQNKRYREAKERLNKIWDENYYRNPNEYDGGYLDGLDRAIGIVEALEGEE